jgi:hypothetical protein
MATTPFVLKRFSNDAIGRNRRELVTAPLWSGNNVALYTAFTSSDQSDGTKRYFYELYNSQSIFPNAEVQFSVAYGDSKGSGSSTGSYGAQDYDYPTRAVYSQYRQLLLPPGVNAFEFTNGNVSETSEYVYVINVNRSRYKDRMDTSTWQLSLGKLNSVGSSSISTAADVFTFIDDSGTTTTELSVQGGRVYNVVSGTLAGGKYTGSYASTPWGLYYPDHGIIVMNGKALDASASFYTSRSRVTTPTENYTGSLFGDNNAYRLFTSISGAMAFNTASYSFQGRTSEVVASTYYFVRVYSDEYNYTNNPSFFNQNNVLKYESMIMDPKVYITSVGLYDNENNLVAVAKLSKPIQKSFDREVVIKVKLDY